MDPDSDAMPNCQCGDGHMLCALCTRMNIRATGNRQQTNRHSGGEGPLRSAGAPLAERCAWMFGLLHNLYKYLKKKSERKVTFVLLGLDNAGKTTLLNTINGQLVRRGRGG